MEQPVLQVVDCNSESLVEKEISSLKDIRPNISNEGVTWLNIYGLHEIKLIKELGEVFSIPFLVLEDILNTDQRPKSECFENFDVFIL